MHIAIVTLLPEMFAAISEQGVSSRAMRSGLVKLDYVNPRDYTEDKHRTVDDKPFGGGPGMLMKSEPLMAAITESRRLLNDADTQEKRAYTVYLSPQGVRLNQGKVLELANKDKLVLVCGRYQGVDARLLETEIDEEVSLGDFVLSGGELAAMALVDAMIRFQPGALGDEGSAQQDSFANGLLHCPEYTRPQEIDGVGVPEVLLSGDHEAIRKWRLKQSLGVTWLKRPDLLETIELDQEQEGLLKQFIEEHQQ